MLMVLVGVQACLWAHAGTLVQTAAAEGVQVACDRGGSVDAGIARAQQFLAEAGSSSVAAPQVQASEPAAGLVEVHVRGQAESVLPWLHLGVSATRRGTVQEFRSGR